METVYSIVAAHQIREWIKSILGGF